MNPKYVALILSMLLSAATGCARKSLTPPASQPMMALVSTSAASPLRFIAEKHELEIVTSESGLEKSWDSALAFCGTIQCETLSSSITTRSGGLGPSGSISLRIAPGDLKKLFDHLEKLGRIAKHETQREDKTVSVVDAEARIKNLTSFRDSLRGMLAKPSATVKDLVEIQKQLTETQSQLDAEIAQRKILANETEKIAVHISFRVEIAGGGTGGFAEIWDALRESGPVLAESTATLITVIVTLAPWLILIVPAVWFLSKTWRKLRRKRTVSSPPSLPQL